MKKRIRLAFNFDGDFTLKTFSLLPIAADEGDALYDFVNEDMESETPEV